MNLPSDFKELVQPIFADEMADFEQSLAQSPVVSVRVNDKIDLPQFSDQIPWCKGGFYLDERPSFTHDPLFHVGAYYVQEASSMFLQHVLEKYVDENAIILDLCAAPGGKSTLISQYLSDKGLLVANEYVRQRSQILSENLQKWGNPNVIVTNNDSAKFADFIGIFDAILIDAPCSGEGMFRKDETAIAEWSLKNVENCVERQREIISNAWNALKTNGILIYSTCTFNTHENEEQVRWICENFDAEILQIPLDSSWKITQTAEGNHFYPHKTKGEGLFMTALRKKSSETTLKIKEKVVAKKMQGSPFEKWIKNADEYLLFEQKNYYSAFAKRHSEFLQLCLNKLNVIHFGITLAEQKGKDYIPQQSLALNKVLNNYFNRVELTLEQSISYLRTETLNLPDAPRGFLLVCYQNVPFGWVKNIGQRCNNLYPQQWRIRF